MNNHDGTRSGLPASRAAHGSCPLPEAHASCLIPHSPCCRSSCLVLRDVGRPDRLGSIVYSLSAGPQITCLVVGCSVSHAPQVSLLDQRLAHHQLPQSPLPVCTSPWALRAKDWLYGVQCPELQDTGTGLIADLAVLDFGQKSWLLRHAELPGSNIDDAASHRAGLVLILVLRLHQLAIA